MIKSTSWCLCLTLLVMMIVSCSDGDSTNDLYVDGSSKIVVEINDRALTRKEMHGELLNLLLTVGQNMSAEELEYRRPEFELQAIQNLINTELMVTEARNRGIKVSDEKIQAQIKLLQDGYASGERFQQELNLRALTPTELRREAERALLVDSLVEQVVAVVPTPADDEVQKFYTESKETLFVPEQIRAGHILLTVLPDDPDEVRNAKRTELMRIKGEMSKGATFESLANKYSDCPSAARGGDLGWFPKDRMAPEFTEAAFALAPGEVSDVVTTSFGYHLIKLYEHRDKRTPELEEIKLDLTNYLLNQQRRVAIEKFIEELRARNEIDVATYSEVASQ